MKFNFNDFDGFAIRKFSVINIIFLKHTTEKGKPGFNCCKMENDPNHENLIKNNSYCAQIPIDKSSDSCYKDKIDCMHYSKTMHAYENCDLTKPAAPLNFHTPYLDLELIYSAKTIKHLRENEGIFDIENNSTIKHLLLEIDERSGQLPGLYFMVTLFTKFHDFFVTEARDFKIEGLDIPFILDELIFEARKATTAVSQIVFVHLIQSVVFGNFFCCYTQGLDTFIFNH